MTLLSSFITIGFHAYGLIRSLNECCLDKGVFDEALPLFVWFHVPADMSEDNWRYNEMSVQWREGNGKHDRLDIHPVPRLGKVKVMEPYKATFGATALVTGHKR